MTEERLYINGEVYLNTKGIAEKWGVNPKTVSKYCKENKIKNKFKKGNKGWYIREDEMKPITKKDIRKILFVSQQLRSKPDYKFDDKLFRKNEEILEKTYQHLVFRGYLKPFTIENKMTIPYEVVLTQQGIELLGNFRERHLSDIVSLMKDWLPIIISIAQLYFQIKS